ERMGLRVVGKRAVQFAPDDVIATRLFDIVDQITHAKTLRSRRTTGQIDLPIQIRARHCGACARSGGKLSGPRAPLFDQAGAKQNRQRESRTKERIRHLGFPRVRHLRTQDSPVRGSVDRFPDPHMVPVVRDLLAAVEAYDVSLAAGLTWLAD